MTGWLSGWRLALRLAWREAWRARSRSLLVLVMVTFPVVGVIAADVAQATASVSATEGLDRRIGTAQARVTAIPHVGHVMQTADPDSMFSADGRGGSPASWATVRGVLGDRRAVELETRQASIRTGLGVLRVGATGVDPTDPLTSGLFRLTSGRFPTGDGEVAINAALARHGFAVGDRLRLADGTSARVVGIAESTQDRTPPILLATPAFFPPAGRNAVRTWLVGGGPVTWPQVLELNRLGMTVLSREVMRHPPSTDELPAQLQGVSSGADRATLYTVLALIAVMALIEVVLLAGPAFAVGARRQSRSLALIAANGGTPRQSRRVVLAAAVVIGGVSALAGIGLGIGLGRGLLPVLQSRSETYFGPFQVRWTHVLAIAAFGLVSALLAAVVPAWVASRQDVVAVLAGRRGDRAAGRRSPVLGVLLAGAGVAVATLGARRDSSETLIAAAAVLTVLGMILLVPVVVVAVARLGRRLPLPLRYAVRDAARHRTRTVPAVAAVAATVAGTVALSIGNTSDQAQARAQYTPVLPAGMGQIYLNDRHPDWAAAAAAVRRVAPAARVLAVPSVSSRQPVAVEFPLRVEQPLSDGGAAIDDGTDPALDLLMTSYLGKAGARHVDGLLRRGRVVVFSGASTTADHVNLRLRRHRHRLAAAYVPIGGGSLPSALVPPATARRLGLHPVTQRLVLTGRTLTPGQESDLQQVLAGLSGASDLYVERGYQVPSSERIVLWILFGLAALLMLGGTLTATFLALSDARPDLATLSAVGASPRTRRAVAAAYAVSVGFVGALLGAAVGFVPGIAVSYPLTRGYVGASGPSHYLVIPWLEIAGLVILLPLLTAAIVGLAARSRLPLVARLD
jgi:putative ABC transport system permease protein